MYTDIILDIEVPKPQKNSQTLTFVMLNKLRCQPISDFQPTRLLDLDCWYKFTYLKWQAVQIQTSWLFQKPTDLDLHCLQR